MKSLHGSKVLTCDGDKATPETVLAGLQEYPWVHFACHGKLDNGDEPYKSCFVLHQGNLSLRQIMQANLRNAELAFLAACSSAAVDLEGAPEEAVSLAVAIQSCGYCSVVGTLWTMSDRDGPPLARDFYAKMFEGELDVKASAAALHDAVKNLRAAGVPIERWATFIHIGV